MRTIYLKYKKAVFSTIIGFLSFVGYSQITPTSQENYIYVIEPTVSVTSADNSTTGHHSVQYFDGLGRPKQSVQVKSSSEGKDIVTKIEYDVFGRQAKDYLPVPTEQTNGAFIPDPTSAYTGYYGIGTVYNTNFYYSEKELEASPLNRVMSQAAPGDDWAQGSGHEIRFEYTSNAGNEIEIFNITTSWDNTDKVYKNTVSRSGKYYAEGLFYKTITTDENGNDIEEFKNKLGQVVLKRTYEGTHTLYTHYIYDKFNNLILVIPPLAYSKPSLSTAVLDGLCYQYRYDNKKRLAEKKLPGKGWEYMVYDKQGRLVAVQDPVQRENNNWLFTKYDKFGRLVYTGIYNQSVTRVGLQGNVDGFGNNNETRDDKEDGFTKNGLTVSYTSVAFPTSFNELLTVNYYDDYEFEGAPTPPATVLGEPVITDEPQAASQDITTKTLLTASMLRIPGTDTWERTYNYYDAKLRVLRTYKSNYLDGYTQVDSEYDFRGKVLKTITTHRRTETAPEITVEDNFTYSPQERLLTHTQKINGGTPQRIATNEYDKLGQIQKKEVGNTASLAALQKVNYAYNIRGWLTNINDVNDLTIGTDPVDLFTFKINYNDPVQTHFPSGSGVVPLHNGNIAETFWRTASDNILRGYGYKYDELNRLKDARYQKPGATNPLPGNYDENLVYDLNGNITTLSRFSGTDTPTGAQMTDHLDYTYFPDSNQLKKVTDLTNSATGFNNGSSGTADDYTYDANGNMLTDLNKGISTTPITYNHLNLPVKIQWTSTKKIEYLYNAAGIKVQKKVTDGASIKITDYLDGFQYNQNLLEFFPHSEGYVKVTAMGINPSNPQYSYNYVFNYTDHLGNVRLSYSKDPQTGNLKILDEAHYYPFGLKHTNYNTSGFVSDNSQVIIAPIANNPFKYSYNNTELQDELGLNMYAMDMRQYDPAIARWVVMDPVAHHSMSPYNAFDNNPVFWADPSGADSEKTTQELIDGIRNATPENGSFFWQNTKKNKKNEDENEDGDENDDIRFRDKNGNVIATFETKEIDDDVYLPVEVTDGEPNININVLMRLAGIDIEDIDIVGIGGSWDFAFGMGGSKGIEYVYFLDGKNAGCWQAFIVEKGNVGLMGSAGVYGIIGDYYNDNSLTIGDYAGTSFSFNVGVKGPWIGSYGKFWAPKPEIKDNLGIKSGFNTNLRSWTGYTVGGGLGAGAQWSKQNTRIYNP